MYNYEDIKRVHLEITSLCNASCPLCSRNFFGGQVNPYLPQSELSLDDIKKIFPPDFVKQLELIYMCGNYGDPMVAVNTIEAFEYFRACSRKIKLGIHTNGSGRTPEWWKRLAKTVDYCCFGIDGLKDTNHIYRRRTNWEKIMQSASAFIEAGGYAMWQFIVFRHNENQVEEARELSLKLGFKEFLVRKTYRFLTPSTGVKRSDSPVIDKKGNLEYKLEEPVNANFRNSAVVQIEKRMSQPKDFASYLNETEISCKVSSEKKIYVSAEGLVFPCCWVAGIYNKFRPFETTPVGKIIAQMPAGKNSLNAKLISLKEIIDDVFFQKIIPATWQSDSLENGRLEVCARICGKHDIYSGQFDDNTVNLTSFENKTGISSL